MKRKNAMCIILLILAGLFCSTHLALADVTIQNGSTLTVNGANLDMNCSDIIVAEGATLDLGSGVVNDLGELAVDPAGTFIEGTGTLNPCSVTGQGRTGRGRRRGPAAFGGACIPAFLRRRLLQRSGKLDRLHTGVGLADSIQHDGGKSRF